MLEALAIFFGLGAAAEIVGVLVGTNAGINAAGKAVETYGDKVRTETRAECDEEMAKRAVESSAAATDKANKAWGEAMKGVQKTHAKEMVRAAETAQNNAVRALIASGHLRNPE